MDQETRNHIQHATQDARELLEGEYSKQLEGTYDILADGTIPEQPGEHLDERKRLTRERLLEAIQHKIAGGMDAADAVAEYRREAAFTTLNRFVALKMLEARELVQECVSRGKRSSGFGEFTGLAPGLSDLPDDGYRLYIESLFDEIGREVGVLFDRRDPASLLWPRRQVLEDLLEILNADDLEEVWEEDETIGWVYQYFNSSDERSQMRSESQAPRNSHELAVRNQFFTPRYVVEFLTDNTLGRIWYEMRQGETALTDQCDYLVRRPNEVFLDEGEDPPEDAGEDEEELTQEELLKKTEYIPFRALKDPRDIRVLDPACGSGHFLLYAFVLLVTIYREAWEAGSGLQSEATGNALREDYSTWEELEAALPGLILRHNLHGIEIDHRAAQIASLALWMRAQRAYNEQDIPRSERAAITRTNVVVAEPMPGEKDMLEEFLRELREDRLEGLMERVFDVSEGGRLRATRPMADSLCELVETVWDKMELAGEAGSLLKIEEELDEAIAESRREWEQKLPLFRVTEMNIKGEEKERYPRTLPGEEDDFWSKAETLVLTALEQYAERARNGRSYRRRLFAEDAAHAFAHIDICRSEYSVILMNPPYGSNTDTVEDYLSSEFSRTQGNLYTAFIERSWGLLENGGFCGALTERMWAFQPTYRDMRETLILPSFQPCIFADLMHGVLDGAFNRTAAYTLIKSDHRDHEVLFYDERQSSKKDKDLLSDISGTAKAVGNVTVKSLKTLCKYPGRMLVYSLPPNLEQLFLGAPQVGDVLGCTAEGRQTSHDARYVRLHWELPIEEIVHTNWYGFAKGGDNSSFFRDEPFLVNWSPEAREQYLNSGSRQIPESRREPKIGWSDVASRLDFQLMSPKTVTSPVNQGIVLYEYSDDELWTALAYLNSDLPQAVAAQYYDGHHWQPGIVSRLPYPKQALEGVRDELVELGQSAFDAIYRLVELREESRIFLSPFCGGRQKAFECMTKNRAKYRKQVDHIKTRINNHVSEALGLGGDSKDFLDRALEGYREIGDADILCDFGAKQAAEHTFSYVFGALLGRWDIRLVKMENARPPRRAPSPMPTSPPGMLVASNGLQAEPTDICSEKFLRARVTLQGMPETKKCEDGLMVLDGAGKVLGPAMVTEGDYPLSVAWDGIMVDDPGHPDDIIHAIREVFRFIWGEDQGDEKCRGAVKKLDQRSTDLRDYFRKKGNTGFFLQQVKRYSKSRRKAPIYWQLATPSMSYAVWLYYHRFTRDTLYQVQNDYVEPKLQHEERRLNEMRDDIGADASSREREEIDDQEDFVEELRQFRDEVARIAPLWNPDLNDGVIINYAPLWRLVGPRKWQKRCKKTWDKLVDGEYDWAHLAMHLWPERVIPKCAERRDLAIAHDLENVFWEENEDGDWEARDVSEEEVNELIEERTYPAVKAALEDLLSAPTA